MQDGISLSPLSLILSLLSHLSLLSRSTPHSSLSLVSLSPLDLSLLRHLSPLSLSLSLSLLSPHNIMFCILQRSSATFYKCQNIRVLHYA